MSCDLVKNNCDSAETIPTESYLHMHGYGRGAVKGMNLSFKNKVLIDGRQITELTFELNHVHLERVKKIFQNGHPQFTIQQARFDLGKAQIYSRGTLLSQEGVGSVLIGPERDSVLMGPERDSCLRNRVIVHVNRTLGLKGFQQLLAPLGLLDVLEQSTAEDVERLKVGLLFRTIDPKNSFLLERSPFFFDASIDELKLKIIGINRAMERVFEVLPSMEKREMVPGHFRYTVPGLAQQVYGQGGRALTTYLRHIDFDEEPKRAKKELELVAIFKKGLLSRQQQALDGLNKNCEPVAPALATDVVYTQMILDQDVKQAIPFKKLSHYYQDSDFQLFFSLNALETGSYQYLNCGCLGRRAPNPEYSNRLSIDKFPVALGQTPADSPGVDTHEILIKHLIRPEEIKGMWIKYPADKERIIALFRQHGIIKKESSGAETINGIPLDQFFHTGRVVTEAMVRACAPLSRRK
jgi:hypothetical protein